MEKTLPPVKRLEIRSLTIAMWFNLIMAVAGVVAAFATNSNAIMMDGLFSLIGVFSALLARRISRNVDLGPDRWRPYGYSADEAIFVTFRSLTLLGLVLTAVTAAAKRIYDYLNGVELAPLSFGPMLIYFGLIGAMCFALWAIHRRAFIRSGGVSAILATEGRAAIFDGAVTAAAAIGMGVVYLASDGPLAPIAPIGDSIIVILLCLAAIGQYFRDVRSGLGELAGVTAAPETIAIARRSLRPALTGDGGRLVDLSVVKSGRLHVVTVYYDPQRAMTAEDIDRLNLRLLADMRQALPGSEVILLITAHPRRWPDELWNSLP